MRFPLDRYLNAQTAQAPQWSPDGGTILFLADVTGVPQLWQIDAAGGWPQQLTFTRERVMRGVYAHHTPIVVFGMDAGGNEAEQLYVLRDGEVTPLGVQEGIIHTFGAISPDDTWVAYSDNSRNGTYFDIYMAPLGGGDAQRVYEDDSSNYVADWSPDGREFLIHRRTGSLDAELFLFDVGTMTARHLTPHDGIAQYETGRFAPDGASIYLLTDQNSEYLRAARLDLASGQIEFLTPDANDVEDLALSPDGDRLALAYNVDGYSKLVIRSTGTGEEREVEGLPEGVVTGLQWSPDGEKLAFAFTGPDRNLNIWVWEGEEPRQLTFVPAGGIPRQAFARPETVRFRSFDGLEVPAYLYLPEGEEPPVVVHVHGGPESQARPIFNPVIQYLVARGYAVLAPNVRGSTGYGRTYTHLDDKERRMDSVADLQAAVEWLRQDGRVAGDRIAVMGGSYGGFMVLAGMTSYPDLWAAGVDIVGVANFESFFEHTSPWRRHWRAPEYGDPVQDRDLLRAISPIHKVDRIQAPLLVIHGDNDPRVPLEESQQIVEAVGSRLPVEFIRFPDEGHGVIKLANKLVAYEAVAQFLDRFLMREPVLT